MSTNRWAGARCTNRRDLPWTADVTPSPDEMRVMSTVCADCPVLAGCAQYALTRADGGFYAGIWVPWSRTTSEPLQATRRNARQALRRVAVNA